jgi:hypothetical protein
MEYELHHRICLYCGEVFEANNGNRLHCPKKHGKKDFCKNQAKHLREIRKRGGRTESEKQTFLKQNLGFSISKEFLRKNLFKIESKNYNYLLKDNLLYSKCYFEGNYGLLLNKDTEMYLILKSTKIFAEIHKWRGNQN